MRRSDSTFFVFNSGMISERESIFRGCDPAQILNVIIRAVPINMIYPALFFVFWLIQKRFCNQSMDVLCNRNTAISAVFA